MKRLILCLERARRLTSAHTRVPLSCLRTCRPFLNAMNPRFNLRALSMGETNAHAYAEVRAHARLVDRKRQSAWVKIAGLTRLLVPPAALICTSSDSFLILKCLVSGKLYLPTPPSGFDMSPPRISSGTGKRPLTSLIGWPFQNKFALQLVPRQTNLRGRL